MSRNRLGKPIESRMRTTLMWVALAKATVTILTTPIRARSKKLERLPRVVARLLPTQMSLVRSANRCWPHPEVVPTALEVAVSAVQVVDLAVVVWAARVCPGLVRA